MISFLSPETIYTVGPSRGLAILCESSSLMLHCTFKGWQVLELAAGMHAVGEHENTVSLSLCKNIYIPAYDGVGIRRKYDLTLFSFLWV